MLSEEMGQGKTMEAEITCDVPALTLETDIFCQDYAQVLLRLQE